MEKALEFNDYLLYLSDLDLNTCDEDARLDLWTSWIGNTSSGGMGLPKAKLT